MKPQRPETYNRYSRQMKHQRPETAVTANQMMLPTNPLPESVYKARNSTFYQSHCRSPLPRVGGGLTLCRSDRLAEGWGFQTTIKGDLPPPAGPTGTVIDCSSTHELATYGQFSFRGRSPRTAIFEHTNTYRHSFILGRRPLLHFAKARVLSR